MLLGALGRASRSRSRRRPSCAPTRQIVAQAGEPSSVVDDPRAAAAGAHALYTDVWVSMGDEDEAERRRQLLAPYQLNEELLSAARDDAVVLHCLPAHPGEEITEGLLYGERSAVWDQAENRLHAQKALLEFLLADADARSVYRRHRSSMRTTGARRTGLRGRLVAADRLNLIRVMPAQERWTLTAARDAECVATLRESTGVRRRRGRRRRDRPGDRLAWPPQRGLRTLVLDAGEPARGATGRRRRDARAGHRGRLRRGGADRAEPRGARARYPAFVAELEARPAAATGYRRDGHAERRARPRPGRGAAPPARVPALRSGSMREWLSARECRALEPGLSPRVAGGVLAPGDHQVVPRAARARARRGARASRRRAAHGRARRRRSCRR